MTKTTDDNFNVAFLVYQHVLATSLTLPIEMLKAGEAFAKQQSNSYRKLNIELVGKDMAAVESRAGIYIVPDSTVTQAQLPDVIIAPSLWRNPRPVLRNSESQINWLNQSWQQGATIVGVGTGVCFLAQSGLLNNHPATTHWHYFEQFKRDYPLVELKPDFFITQSLRIYCAASLNAQADIIVHLIEQVYGVAAAQHVERNFSHEIRKPYEEQRYLEGAADRHPDELIAQIQFWMKHNLTSTLTLVEISQQFGISQRSLTRRFKVATNTSATKYWQRLRLETVKELLGSSNLSIQEIALAVGYQDQGHITRLFKRQLGTSPSEYRVMVRKKLFSEQ
ncbi:MAG: helix-turn-helix domain-containing protein [Gammaproteobacteria bacterium]|nr:helix-turn-helix domain-containing protein [Gammaproteobacteria bacterium]